MGEALLHSLRSILGKTTQAGAEIRLHGYKKLQRDSLSEIDKDARLSYAYLLPFAALQPAATTTSTDRVGGELRAAHRDIYRQFKIVLQSVLQLEKSCMSAAEGNCMEDCDQPGGLMSSDVPCLEQFKMAERV